MSTICQLHADLRYYLCMQPVDMRKQFQGLQGIINAEFGRQKKEKPCKFAASYFQILFNGPRMVWRCGAKMVKIEVPLRL